VAGSRTESPLALDGRRLLAVAAALAAVVLPTTAEAASMPSMSAKDVIKRLASGPLTRAGYRIDGPLTFGRRLVRYELTCRDCTFDGPVSAIGTTFAGTIDLSGSAFRRDTSFAQATFRGPALFGPTETRLNDSDCSSRARARFLAQATFTLATFEDLAVFSDAVFRAPVSFSFARFHEDAVFAEGCSLAAASFRRTAFGATADFGAYQFSGPPSFDDAAFHGRTDFSQAIFSGSASFARARFDEGANFEGAQFDDDLQTSAIDTFDGVTAGGPLDFAFAALNGRTLFTYMSSTGPISLRDADIEPQCVIKKKPTGECLSVDQVNTPDLELSVSAALHALKRTQRADVLGQIESSAKARDDIATANDAHYAHRVLDSRRDKWPLHALDFAFYRVLAGYFVRPLQPLAALLVLAALATLVRFGRARLATREASHRRASSRLARVRGHALHTAHNLGDGYVRTLAQIGPGWKSSTDDRQSRWAEILAYRLLLACVLIGLANSNPTLRQMFDAIR
jgi:pentapeptide repeat protein